MKKITFLGGFLLILGGFTSQAQSSDVELFVSDMLKIADDFASPAAEGAQYQSGAGWFTSAENLDLWKIDLSVHGNFLFVPEKKRSTYALSSTYSTFDIRGAESAEIPSAFGGTTDIYFEGELDFLGNTVPIEFNALSGVNKKVLIHPLLQASVGVPFGTDVTVRFLPEMEIDGVSFSTYGIGLKHNFNQYIFNSQPTDFQFAAVVAFSKFDVHYAFEPLIVENIAELNEIEIDADMLLLELLGSKRFRNSNWSVFGGVGLTNSDFGYVVGGGGIAIEPINTALTTLNNNEMEFKGDLGLTYELGNFLLSSMFSQGKFSNLHLSLHYRL